MLKTSLKPVVALVGANFFKIAGVLIINKVAAVKLSPEDFGIFNQFLSVAAIINMLSSAGLNNAIVRDVSALSAAERHEKSLEYFWITLVFSFLIALVILGLYPFLGEKVLGTSALEAPVILLGLSIPAFAFYNFSISLYSGLSQQSRGAKLQSYGILFGCTVFGFIASFMPNLLGLSIGYLLFLIAPAVIMLFTLPLTFSRIQLNWKMVYLKLGDSAAMFSAILFLPMSLIVVRSHLANLSGWDIVATWQVLTRLSDVYMQIFGIYFAHFFMQKLQGMKDILPLLVRTAASNLVLILTIGILFYTFYNPVVSLLFTSDYLWGRDFVIWQVGLDALKVLTIVLMYTFIVKRKFGEYIFVELIQAITLTALIKFTALGNNLTGVYQALTLAALTGLLLAIVLYIRQYSQQGGNK